MFLGVEPLKKLREIKPILNETYHLNGLKKD
jgi:hypothetical protein